MIDIFIILALVVALLGLISQNFRTIEKYARVIAAHKTLEGKVRALIGYVSTHPTQDKDMAELIQEIAKTLSEVKVK
jgi:hypothetical protein